jgi:hypothetical protein
MTVQAMADPCERAEGPRLKDGAEEPVTIRCQFTVPDNLREDWVRVWDGIKTQALQDPHCESFECVPPSESRRDAVVICGWDSHWHFDQFFCRSGAGWVDRVMPGVGMPRAIDVRTRGGTVPTR